VGGTTRRVTGGRNSPLAGRILAVVDVVAGVLAIGTGCLTALWRSIVVRSRKRAETPSLVAFQLRAVQRTAEYGLATVLLILTAATNSEAVFVLAVVPIVAIGAENVVQWRPRRRSELG